MTDKRAGEIFGGTFLIGLALLFITGWWWPGILYVIGIALMVRAVAQGKSWTEERGGLVVFGARCQPWLANVTFTALNADDFEAYAEPGQVKIAWTLETEELAPALTRLGQETRAAATDEAARTRFRRYWRWARFGIISIRLLLLPAIRRAAERRWAVEQSRT